VGSRGEERIKRKRSSLLPSEANKFYNGGLEKEDYSLLFSTGVKRVKRDGCCNSRIPLYLLSPLGLVICFKTK
jgi:hypothetical protein